MYIRDLLAFDRIIFNDAIKRLGSSSTALEFNRPGPADHAGFWCANAKQFDNKIAKTQLVAFDHFGEARRPRYRHRGIGPAFNSDQAKCQ
ncbi:MAG TPA: hypothetical protein DHW36_13755 [Thalassospira sp.]|nr:hypothetical protein [Thalassospira sp.]